MEVPYLIRLRNFVQNINENRDMAWGIPLSYKSNVEPYLSAASKSELSRTLNIPMSFLQGAKDNTIKYTKLLNELNDILISEKVLLEQQIASALEVRRVTILWWRGLSENDKKNLALFGNSIRFKKYIRNWRGGKNYEIITELGIELNNELILLGILKADYLSVVDRNALLDKNFIKRRSESGARWDQLGCKNIDNYNDFVRAESTTEPFVQLKQLAAIVQNSYSNRSSKSNSRDAYKHLCNYLIICNIKETSNLEDILDEFILVRFKQDYLIPLLDSNEMSPNTVPTILSAIRKMLDRAISLKDFNFYSYCNVGFSTRGRTTDAYKPYTLSERASIHDAIQNEIDDILLLLKPYEVTGFGENPIGKNDQIISGKSTLENARYLFENDLNCLPVYFNSVDTVSGNAFLSIVTKHEIGLHELYKSWGVLSRIDMNTLSPFLFRLAQITGMNADPLCDLTIDDLVMSHETTQMPCLRYWKERSTGQKELHLDLFDAKLQWLTKKQGIEVKQIFENIIKLTSNFRSDASEDINRDLFIYKSSGSATFNKVISLSKSKENRHVLYGNFVKRHQLKSDFGKPLAFSITRFRPTFVSEMIDAGVSIREIQLMLGHSNIRTTVNYLDRLDFNRIARGKLNNALNDIHKRVVIGASSKDAPKSNKYESNPDRVIFKTPLSGCSNIFSPPEFIRNSSLYVKGQPCSQYNKCLSCENVMITIDKLPQLFAMQRDYTLIMQRNRIMETPYGVVIEENLSILDEILNPKKSDFSIEDLEYSEKLSIFEETAVIDEVTG